MLSRRTIEFSILGLGALLVLSFQNCAVPTKLQDSSQALTEIAGDAPAKNSITQEIPAKTQDQ